MLDRLKYLFYTISKNNRYKTYTVLILTVLLLLIFSLIFVFKSNKAENHHKEDKYTLVGKYTNSMGVSSEFRVYEKNNMLSLLTEEGSQYKKDESYDSIYGTVPVPILKEPKYNSTSYVLDKTKYTQMYKKLSKKGSIKSEKITMLKGLLFVEYLRQDKNFIIKSKYVDSDYIEFYLENPKKGKPLYRIIITTNTLLYGETNLEEPTKETYLEILGVKKTK